MTKLFAPHNAAPHARVPTRLPEQVAPEVGCLPDTGDLRIRAARSRDFNAVDSLFANSYPKLLRKDYAPGILLRALPKIARANLSLLRSDGYFVLENHKQEILAAGGITREPPGGHPGRKGIGHMRHIVVHHALARKGLGRMLLTHILNHARQKGVTRIDCLSTLTAAEFYESQGFVRLGQVELSLGPGVRFPALQMQRQTAAPPRR